MLGRPPPASGAIAGTKAWYSSPPTRASARVRLARVRLGSPDQPRNQRQHGDPDHPPRLSPRETLGSPAGSRARMGRCPAPSQKPLLQRRFPRRATSTSRRSSQRLREELAGGANGVEGRARPLLAARRRAERRLGGHGRAPAPPAARRYAVSSPPRSSACCGRFLRWYVEPLAAEQRVFNDAVLKLIDGVLGELDARRRRRRRAARSLDELEERLTRVERRGPDAAAAPRSPRSPRPRRCPTTSPSRRRCAARPPTSANGSRSTSTTSATPPRCSTSAAAAASSSASSAMPGSRPAASTPTRDMVAYARGEGLEVEQADALAYLDGLADGELGGIFAAQVVEHLPPPTLFRLLAARGAEAPPGGHPRRRDDQPALAARPPRVLRRPDARAAARSRDARAAREAGRVPRASRRGS